MSINSVNLMVNPSGRLQDLTSRATSAMFDQTARLGRLGTQKNAGPQDTDKLREVTADVYGSVFFGTLLKAMRDSEMKGPYGHGGRGEEIFSAQLHDLLAKSLGEATSRTRDNFLYESLTRQSRGVSAGQKQTETQGL